MNPKSYELLCAVLLGSGQLCIMTGMVIGAGVIGAITTFTAADIAKTDLAANKTIAKIERKYGDIEIFILFGVFTTVSILGSIIFALLPSEETEDCIEGINKGGSPWDEFVITCETLIDSNMLQLFPLFALIGTTNSLFMSILPTSLQFNLNNSGMMYLPAVYSLGLGIGEILMGIFISMMSQRVKNFSLRPTTTIAVILMFIYCSLIVSSTPFDAPMRPTSAKPLLFSQSYYLIFAIGLLIGLSDNCLNTSRGVICTLSMPSRVTQAHAISKLIQAASSCLLFFISPWLNIYFYTIGLPLLAVFTVFLFFPLSRTIEEEEADSLTETLSSASSKIQ
ncbi:unnamed protein product [Caenorhabditis bovis]|uniref:Uncharacterized protein n=1 Tax=Caenorhabditis bovis TaxID=2654633 RepID=A0A8S1EFN9_9PELO|nr:unnamed protein product [Caenorhabditis bovis]